MHCIVLCIILYCILYCIVHCIVLCIILYVTLYCNVHCIVMYIVVHCALYCIVYCIIFYNVLYCTLYCNVHCIVLYCTLHCGVHCFVLYSALYCTLHCTVHCIVMWCEAFSYSVKNWKKCASANKVLCMCLTLNNVMICLTILYFRTRIKIFCGGEYFGFYTLAWCFWNCLWRMRLLHIFDILFFCVLFFLNAKFECGCELLF